MLEVDIRRFREGSIIPTRAEDGSAGLDVYAWTPDVRGADRRVQVIPAHKSGTISTGLNIRIPRGYCITVIPRSGLAFKNNITVVNSPGLIDSSYDGDGEDFEIKIGLMNHSDTDFEVKHGDRVDFMFGLRGSEAALCGEFLSGASEPVVIHEPFLNLVNDIPSITRNMVRGL